MIIKDKLDQIHRNIPKDYYQQGMQKNLFQRFWHQSRFKLITTELKKLDCHGRILDLGCHSGDLTNIIYLTTRGELYGLDISPEAIKYAQERFPQIHFIACDFSEKIPFPDNYFQVITAFDVLEHLPDVPIILAEVKRLLKPGGYFIVGVPSESFLFRVVWFFWLKFKGQVWEGTHLHKFRGKDFLNFSQQGFSKVLEKKIIFKMWHFIGFNKK